MKVCGIIILWEYGFFTTGLNFRKECNMYKRFVNALYLLNIIFQGFLNLLTPIGLGLLISYLLTSYANSPSWIYAPFTVFGVFVGLFSMVKFILSATKALDRLEKEQAKENYKASDEQKYKKGFSQDEE